MWLPNYDGDRPCLKEQRQLQTMLLRAFATQTRFAAQGPSQNGHCLPSEFCREQVGFRPCRQQQGGDSCYGAYMRISYLGAVGFVVMELLAPGCSSDRPEFGRPQQEEDGGVDGSASKPAPESHDSGPKPLERDASKGNESHDSGPSAGSSNSIETALTQSTVATLVDDSNSHDSGAAPTDLDAGANRPQAEGGGTKPDHVTNETDASTSPDADTVGPSSDSLTSDVAHSMTSDEVESLPPAEVDDPPGYWRQGDWRGCVWAATDDTDAGSTITPLNFTQGETGEYCVSGSVAPTEGWQSFGLLGFNLNQDPATADCSGPADVNAERPPSATVSGLGLAINLVQFHDVNAATLRVLLQGPSSASGANDGWCADVTVVQGAVFLEWDEFKTECWEGGDGSAYNGEEISQIVFVVPGNGWAEGTDGEEEDHVSFDFCINGLSAGDSAEDAPGILGDSTGVLGGEATGADYERVKVSADGASYVIQNNNWGNEAGAQSISYVNNSFTVTDGPDGSPSCQGCPLSFPSIYIGASGNTDPGGYSTRSSDNLPKAISAIQSANTSVSWSGSPGGAANATYDIWFAKTSRGDLTDKRYNDGLDGSIMLWLHDPGGGGSPPNRSVQRLLPPRSTTLAGIFGLGHAGKDPVRTARIWRLTHRRPSSLTSRQVT